MKKVMIILVLVLMAISSVFANHFEPAWQFPLPGQNPYHAFTVFVKNASALGIELESGDEIGVFDGNTCVGALLLDKTIPEYNGGWAPVKVSMDGGNVPDSAIPGHFVKCKIYVASSNTEYSYPDLAVHFGGPPDHDLSPTVFSDLGHTFVYEIRYDVPVVESEYLSFDDTVPVPISFPNSGVELAAIGALNVGPMWFDNYITASGTMTIRYIPAPPIDCHFIGDTPPHVSNYHWHIDPGTIGYAANEEHPIVLKFDTTNLPGTGTDLAHVKVYKREIHGTGQFTECTTTVDGSYLVASITSFSEFILGSNGADTLPVELSSFTACLNAQNQVNIQWVTQSETGVLGFRLYRATDPDAAAAELISPLIPATNSSHSQLYLYKDKDISCDGIYYYWLESSDLDGSSTLHGPISLLYDVWGNHGTPPLSPVNGINRVYPNPFNPIAFISYGLEQKSSVDICIYNARGQMVRHFPLENKEAGTYRAEWDGQNDTGQTCASGVYIVRMNTGMGSFSRKLLLSK
jgi:hypothetical protein